MSVAVAARRIFTHADGRFGNPLGVVERRRSTHPGGSALPLTRGSVSMLAVPAGSVEVTYPDSWTAMRARAD